ncbi:MAG: ABC transporter substrate-binding protein [Fimbriimonadaceae bacterium]
MKGSILAGLAATTAMMMVGCTPAPSGGTDGSLPPKPEGATATGTGIEKPKIAVVIPTATHGWTGGVVYWAEKTAKDMAGDADIKVFASDSPDKQAADLANIATQGFDGLVILSFDPTAITPAVKTARDSFKYIVSVDRGLSEPLADVWLRGDNEKFGSEAATFMADKLGGKGKILVLRGMAGPVDEDRVKGFKSVMDGIKGVQILDMQPGKWSQDEAYKVTQNLLLKYKEVDAIWAADDDMAVGAAKALAEAGRTNVWLVGGGGSKDVIKKVMDGDAMFPATVTYSPKMIALGIERCVADLKAGKKSTGTQVDDVLPVELVKPDNARDHYFPESVY